jgi:hypothetical protein
MVTHWALRRLNVSLPLITAAPGALALITRGVASLPLALIDNAASITYSPGATTMCWPGRAWATATRNVSAVLTEMGAAAVGCVSAARSAAAGSARMRREAESNCRPFMVGLQNAAARRTQKFYTFSGNS